jgi:deoxycytidylate deaminase
MALDCPHCSNVGWTVTSHHHTGEPEQRQCRFCHEEENSIFNYIKALQDRIAELEGDLKNGLK